MNRVLAPVAALFAILGALLVVPATASALVVPMTVPQLASHADTIVEVRVASASIRQASDSGIAHSRAPIVTDSALRTAVTLKGGRGSAFVLTQPGGRIGDVGLSVPELPQLVPGERAILFLDTNGVVGGTQGCLQIVDGRVPALGMTLAQARVYLKTLVRAETAQGGDSSAPTLTSAALAGFAAAGASLEPVTSAATVADTSGAQLAVSALATGPTVTSVSPSAANAGVGSTITIYGSGFGSSRGNVAFPQGNGDPQMLLATISSWSSTAIKCVVPRGAESGLWVATAAGTIGSKYPFHVGYSWSGRRSKNSVSYRVNENTADTTGEADAVKRAMSTWSHAGAPYTLSYGGSSALASFNTSKDGYNDITFVSFKSSGLSAGLLALNAYWYSGTDILESNIFVNDDYEWADGAVSGAFDVQSAVLHELGHTVGLDDQYGDYVYNEVMGAGADNSLRRSLSSWETQGIQHIYGAEKVPPSAVTVTSTTHPAETTWYRSTSATFSFSATDNSGIAGYGIVLDRSATTTPTAVTQAASTYGKALGDGESWLHVRARDIAGNWGPVTHRRVRVDATAPVTTVAVASPYTLSAELKLVASDTHSPVGTTEWTLDGAAGSGTTVRTTELGTHQLAFASVDSLGNREATKTVSFAVAPPPSPDAVSVAGVAVPESNGNVVRVAAPADAANPASVMSTATVGFSAVSLAGELTLARGTFTTPYGWRAFGRSWHLAFSGSVAPTVTVTLPYDPLLTAPRIAGLRVIQWDGTTWVSHKPSSLDKSAHNLTVTLTPEQAFSPLVVAEPSSVSRASKLTLSGNAKLKPEYGSRAYVAVWLKDAFGSVLGSRAVTLRRSDGSVVATLTPSKASAGYYTGSAPLVRSKTVFSAKFAGDSANNGTSLGVTVLPKAKLGVNAPETPTHGRSFYVYGTIAPAHANALVVFEAWKRNSKGVYYKYKSSSVTTSGSSFRKAFSLPAGRWRFRTTHADATHAASSSGWDYIVIK